MTIKVKPLRDRIAEICSEGEDFIGFGASAYDKADRILSAIEEGGDAIDHGSSNARPDTSPGVTDGAVDPFQSDVEAGNTEIDRVWAEVDAIRAKQAAKPRGSALPIAQAGAVDPAAIRAEALRKAAATCDRRAEEIKMETAQICSGSVHRWSLEQRRFEVLLRRDAILSLIDKEQDQ